ncbi:MAG: TonB-dependent receptor [Gammaproteobacteria bacterium]|nr:TonB-dependent receptor [Gammaproteobacteria bacterium]
MTTAAVAADGQAGSFAGRQVVSVIEEFRAAGVEFAYSTNVVTDDLHVAFEPEPGSPLHIMRQILRPHGLTVREESGFYLVVREQPSRAARPVQAAPARPAPADLETVVVAASRYEVSRDLSSSRFMLDQRSIQNMPDIGEDPIRVAQRLPGAAASGASARTHFRGGEENEIGIMLNGQWLFDPFHIRDYQSVFSAIDARAIDGVEVYTGGFPVLYGDRMSGLVLMDSLESEKARHTEIGVSVFNTSLLTAGTRSGHNWVFSARRGNLDLVIDPRFGQPSYFDLFGEYSIELSPHQRLSANALYADDQVELVLETDPEEREQVVSNTKNAQLWLRLDSDWSSRLASTTVLSFVNYSNRRRGTANDPEKMIADVTDDRDIDQFSVKQDWVWNPSTDHLVQWGVQASFGEANYRYDAAAAYFGLQALYANQPANLGRSLAANPEGGSYALYVSDRWKLTERSVLEWGLRWDDQTYTEENSDSQLSPRLSYMFQPWEKGELRVSVGRYHQSQPIQSLQIEDGITNFWPAQRADHVIVGLKQLVADDIAVRAEIFHKDIRDLRPRFENLYDPLGIMPELQPDRVRIEPARARAQGLELTADSVRAPWNWWASYTWSKVTDRIGGRDVPRGWDQRHAFQGGLGWHREGWNFSVAASVHSGWPTTGLTLDDDGAAIPGPRNVERLPTFASLDLRLSRKFDVRRGTLTAFVEVSNALNRRNMCCFDWDIDEDDEGNPVLENSPDYWLPLLPAIGILWEF